MCVLQQVLDDGTDPWGVQVERVEMYVYQFRIFQFLADRTYGRVVALVVQDCVCLLSPSLSLWRVYCG